MKDHERIHNGEKPHHCTKCEKTFAPIAKPEIQIGHYTALKNRTNVTHVKKHSSTLADQDPINNQDMNFQM